MKKALLCMALVPAALLLAPVAANAAEYDTFVGCDYNSFDPIPSHVCQLGDSPGAYFEADENVEYDICVEFPSGSFLCSEEQAAEAEVLYVNQITTNQPGLHEVVWFVGDTEVGSWSFRIDVPPPPPTPVVPPVVTPPPAIVAPAGPSPACQKAKKRINKLTRQLRKAKAKKQKVRIRSSLKGARKAKKRAC